MANVSFGRIASILLVSSILLISPSYCNASEITYIDVGTISSGVVIPIPEQIKKFPEAKPYCNKLYKNKAVVIHIALIKKREALFKTMFYHI